MKAAAAGARQGLLEGRKLWSTLLDEPVTPSGGIVVSGMLAEQLVRELGSGAAPGTVLTREGTSVAGAEVTVRVIAGDPSDEDVAVVSVSRSARASPSCSSSSGHRRSGRGPSS